jgi:hypothetical protein
VHRLRPPSLHEPPDPHVLRHRRIPRRANAHEGPASPTRRVTGHLCRPEARSKRVDPPSPGRAQSHHQAPARVAHTSRGDATPTASAPACTAGRGVASEAERRAHASESERGLPRRLLDRQQLRHTREPGGQAGTATLRRARAAEKPPRAPGRLVYQPAPEERVESVNAAHLAVNACANVPIGGVESTARVPRVRRRGQAAPLGRAWLKWGSCLEDRASGAPAVPPDPKVDDRACTKFAAGRSGWELQTKKELPA